MTQSTSSATERISILAPTLARLPGGGARTYYEHANALAARGYLVSVVHSLSCRPGVAGRLEGLARAKVRDLRAGNLTRRVSWMPIDPRVRMQFVANFDERTTLPAADLRIGTYWLTNEFLANRPPDGAAHLQLIQAYEVWAGPADRVDATWRLPIDTVVVSESLYQRGLQLGVSPDRLHIAANGIDHDTFRVKRPIASRPPRVAFLSHEAPVKGLKESIETLRIVHEQRPDIELVAFGGAARPAVLPKFIDYVRKPIGAQVADLYNGASIFLCASRSEGFGFPSIEAMACGAALVSTRNGGVDDFAVDGESALLCDVGDVMGLSAAILRLADDDALRSQLTKAGLIAVQRFTWEESTNAFASFVRVALDNR
ncbi:MAG: hypothetical protein JWN95_2583 [Frankiales bacterium]|nr:hypothetical protein [Frankiales bacterium]